MPTPTRQLPPRLAKQKAKTEIVSSNYFTLIMIWIWMENAFFSLLFFLVSGKILSKFKRKQKTDR